MMKRSASYLWLFSITILLILHYGQTKRIGQVSLDELGMDEAFLIITNQHDNHTILFTYNMVVCEHCDFENITVLNNSILSQKINTRYPYDFKLYLNTTEEAPICQIQSKSFDEHASYAFEISRDAGGMASCTITPTKEGSYYKIPVICAILFICCLVLIVQLSHRLYYSRYVGQILTNMGHERLINSDTDPTPTTSLTATRQMTTNLPSLDDVLSVTSPYTELPLVGSTRLSNNSIRISKVLPKRLQSLDTFRGFSLMVMIFVNYGGGGYWFFDHSVWNGLTLADLVFPWFVWMMGVSVVLSQRSLLKKKVTKRKIFVKVCRRTVTLFFLGLLLQGGFDRPKNIRILGVLQRLALCYFFTALLVLIFDGAADELQSSQWPIGGDVHQPLRKELTNTVFNFWPQWLFIAGIILTWTLATFVPKIGDCPRGYLGPGGKHDHGKHENCTGGTAGYLDRVILGDFHVYGYPTCQEIYKTTVPYDPEGLLGILTGIFLCYLGVQAAHSFIYSTRVRRVCIQWIVSGLICGALGLLLSKGGHSESWIPINKNMWSLSFIFVLASLAYFILTILYLLVDVYKLFTGAPWIWLGMNSIIIYCGHEICGDKFPIQFKVDDAHAERLAVDVYGVTWWIVISGIMYYKKIFIAI